jgi:glycosyltransferase involved in cell wall biosynthesis
VRHKENGIVVDTTNFQDSMLGLEELIENDALRKQLQLNAIHDVTNYYPEKAAYNIIRYLFGS